VFVIDLASRCVQIVGSTPRPGALFMCHVSRTLTAADTGLLRDHSGPWTNATGQTIELGRFDNLTERVDRAATGSDAP